MKLIFLYLFFIGFISAFSLNKWASLPLIIALILVIQTTYLAIKNKVDLINNKQVTLYSYLFLLVVSFSYLLQVNELGFQIKGFTHTLSYFLVILFYFFSIELSFRVQKVSIEAIFKYISRGVLLVTLITLIEFIFNNFLMIDFDSYVPRSQVEQFDAIYNAGFRVFYRSRGTAEESGVLAIYLLMFLPFLFYYYKVINKNKLKLGISIILVVIAIFSTFSAAGFIELLIALLSVGILKIMKDTKNKISYKFVFTAISSIFLLLSIFMFIYYNGVKFSVLEGIFTKLTFSNDSYSAGSRLERWDYAISLIRDNPLLGHGAGIATLENGTGSTNFYLEVLIETGVIGFLLIAAIFTTVLRMTFKINNNIKFVYIFSIIIVLIHSIVISQYLLPWIWTLLAIITYHYYVIQSKQDNRIF